MVEVNDGPGCKEWLGRECAAVLCRIPMIAPSKVAAAVVCRRLMVTEAEDRGERSREFPDDRVNADFVVAWAAR